MMQEQSCTAPPRGSRSKFVENAETERSMKESESSTEWVAYSRSSKAAAYGTIACSMKTHRIR